MSRVSDRERKGCYNEGARQLRQAATCWSPMTNQPSNDIASLVHALESAVRELATLRFEEEFIGELGRPCTQAQLDTVQHDFGRVLPPSYRAFLELHNGWMAFMGEAALLSVEDRHSPWFAARVEGIRAHLREFNDPDVLSHGFLLVVHPDVSSLLYLDKTKPTEGGEYETVYYSLTAGEYARYPSFKAFLEYWLETTQKQIADERG